MEEINLYDLLRFYTKRWLTIAIAAMIGAIISITYTYFIQQPQYKSSATILLIGADHSGNNQGSVTLNNYVKLFTSRRVLDPVITSSGYSEDYKTLSGNTTAENVKNTDIINVSMSSSDPKTSKILLESAIQEFKEQSKSLYGNSSIRINVVDSPDTSNIPSNIKPVQQVGLATIAAMALSIIVLFFIYDYKKSQLSTNKKHKIKKIAVR